MQHHDASLDPAGQAALQGRQQRAQAVFDEAEARGWQPDPSPDARGRYRLPDTNWCLRCEAGKCVIYRKTEGQGTAEMKWYMLTKVSQITSRLDALTRRPHAL